MSICKKASIIIGIFVALILLISIAPNEVNAAELTDGQRRAFVNYVRDLVDDGNKKGLFRYSQNTSQRMSGYSWTKIRSGKQQTPQKISLTKEDQERVLAKLNSEIETINSTASAGNQQGGANNTKKYESATALRTTTFQCIAYGADVGDTIGFDCSSFCSAMYHHVFGTNFSYASGDFASAKSNFKEIPVAEAKPGDILWKEHHVVIYLGQAYNGVTNPERNSNVDYVAEASSFRSGNTKAESKALADWLIAHPSAIPGHPNYKAQTPRVELPLECVRAANKQVVINKVNLSGGRFQKAYRFIGEVKQGMVVDVTGTTTTNTGDSVGSTGTSSNSTDNTVTVGGPTVEQAENQKYVIGTGVTSTAYWPDNFQMADQALINSDGYFHKGTPAYGGYTQIVTEKPWLVQKAKDVLDWIAGFITMALRMELIGWTAIVENIVSNALTWGTEDMSKQISGDTGALINDYIQGTVNVNLPIVTTNKITVEDIIFNNVPLLDINIFDLQNAGGKQLEQGSAIYNIRTSLAALYYTFRTIALISLLIALLYNIVKVIASTAVADKTNAKEKVKDWLVAFLIVFAIHYLMIGMINLNNQLVKVLEPMGTAKVTTSEGGALMADDINNGSITQNNEKSLYEEIRVMSYDVKASTGWAGTFMYVIMVIFLFMFLITYIKRLFIIIVLTVIAPLIGAMHAINKKTSTMNLWFKEYMYNVLIQLIHVIVYTVLVSAALNMAKTSTIIGGLLALLIIGFIFKAEDITKRILNYNSSELGGLESSLVGQIAMYYTAKKGTQFLGSRASSLWNVGKKTAQFADEYLVPNKVKQVAGKVKMKTTEQYYKAKDIAFRSYESTAAKAKTALDISTEAMKRNVPGLFSEDALGTEGPKSSDFKELYQQYLREMQVQSYRGSAPIQKQLVKWRKQSRAARKAFIKNRMLGVTNAVVATAGITIGVPLLFMENLRGNGIAITGAGINAYRNVFTRKRILGAKSYQHHLKGSKFLFFFASPALAQGYKNASENVIEERVAYKTTYGTVLNTLNEAKELEARIIFKMMDMYSNKEPSDVAVSEAEQRLRDRVNELEGKEFDKALAKASVVMSKQSIEEELNGYLKENKKKKLEIDDYKEIRERLNKKLRESGQEVEISDSFTNNIREQVAKEEGLSANVGLQDIKKVLKETAKDEGLSIKDKEIQVMISELKKDRGFKAALKTQNKEIIVEKIKDMIEQKVRDEKIAKQLRGSYEEKDEVSGRLSHSLADRDKIAKRLSSSFESKMNKQIKEKEEHHKQTVDELIEKMQGKKATDILTKAINSPNGMKVSLKNIRYNDLMQDVRQLERLNDQYYELTDEKIYEDVDKVISQLRKGIIGTGRESN